MRKTIWCSVCCVMLLLISKVFAIEYIDIKVRTISPGYRTIVLYTRKDDEKKEGFWGCWFMQKGNFAESFNEFLDKINGLTVSSVSPIYKLLKEACTKYDKLRYADGNDFENDTIYLFDYSPDNEYFQTIIRNLQDLSECHFDLNLLRNMIIR